MNWISLICLIFFGYSCVPQLYAQAVEDDQSEEWMQDFDDEDDENDVANDEQKNEQPAVATAASSAPVKKDAPVVAQTQAETKPQAPKEEAKSQDVVTAPVVPATPTADAAKTESAPQQVAGAPAATVMATDIKKDDVSQAPQASTAAPVQPPAAQEPAPAAAAEPVQNPTEEKSADAKKQEITPLPEPPKPITALTPEQQEKALAEVNTQELSTIDTVDVSSPEGNWLFKRVWWQKSNELYGKIRGVVDQIADARMQFYTEHVRIDRDLLDPFYASVGFDQGQLTEIAEVLTQELEKKRKKKGALDEKELDYYATVVSAKETIEGFKIGVQSVGQLSDNLRDALIKLVEQLNRARSYESEAWRLLNLIAQELSDKQAREYYYGVLTQWQNIKEIYAYIVGPYVQHFGQVMEALVQKTKEVKTSLDELKDKGVKFGKEVQEHLDKEDEASSEQETPKPVAKKGWWAWLTSWFGW